MALTDEGLSSFEALARRHVDVGGIPGLVAAVAHGPQRHVVVAGELTVGGAPMRRDAQFRIASMTKPMTAAGVLALVAEGALDLDEPVVAHLPELADRRVLVRQDGPLDETVPAQRPITVRDLLTFTFGFGMTAAMFSAPTPWPVIVAAEERDLHTTGPPQPLRQPPLDAWLAGLGELPLIAQPGERWLYNTGASVLGALLARATGGSVSEAMHAKVFAPLGMRDTSMWTAELDRLGPVYQRVAGGLAVWDPPEGQWSAPPAFGDGAAGLLSTIDDVLAFAGALVHGGTDLLPAALVEQMHTNHLTDAQRLRDGGPFLDGAGWGFCQAVVVEGERAGAYGWTGGLGTSMLSDPVRDLVVVVLTQRMFETAIPPSVHRELQDAAFAALAR
jgi:CubicO group peptidase (beta-lactamase class C family)